MKIKKIITGSLQENCYVLVIDKDCLVIDPGDDFKLIKNEIKDYNLLAILVTHHHFDHVGALDELLKYKKVSVYDYNLTDTEYHINKFTFKLIKTPGHTSDSVTFFFPNDNVMFVGDFIFKGSIGRTDLPTGNNTEMEQSINFIKKFNENIKIYPGHGDSTTLKDEIKYNYFFN